MNLPQKAKLVEVGPRDGLQNEAKPVATEDVLYMLNGLGIETGVDLEKLIAAGDYICGVLGRPTHSTAARALMAKARAVS